MFVIPDSKAFPNTANSERRAQVGNPIGSLRISSDQAFYLLVSPGCGSWFS